MKVMFFLTFWIIVSFVYRSLYNGLNIHKDDKWFVKTGKYIVFAPSFAITRTVEFINKLIQDKK
jgi:hypothetical protein